tara:strand:+ start:567 stop:1040 length:474 start_codon:yes stop_codon:yes gene_type:complete
MNTQRIGAVIALAAIAVVLTGCGNSERVARFQPVTPQLKMDVVPANGITAVKDVLVRPQPSGPVQFEAVSTTAFTFDELENVLYCSADQYQRANKFVTRRNLFVEHRSISNAAAQHLSIAAFEFFNPPFPDGVKRTTVDMCQYVPPAALLDTAPNAN